MIISNKGLDLIKKFEGCRLKAYKDPAGVWTIGWGHTKGVKAGDEITQEQADKLLRDDLAVYETKVDKYDDRYHWNQNQFDALVSFAYNIGSIDQLTSNGRRAIKTISDKILEYNKAGGKKLEGLVRRRKAEKELFDEAVKVDLKDIEVEPNISSSKSEKGQEKAPSEVKSPYNVGQVYTVRVNTALNVRKGAGKNYGKVGYGNLTADGKNHAFLNGALKNGTKVTIKEVKVISETEVWVKIPSGWICAIDGAKKYVV